MTLPAHPPLLQTARLVLEPLEPRHSEAMLHVMADRETYRYQSGEPLAFASREALRTRIEHQCRGPRDREERWWNWAIFARENGVAASPARALGSVEISLVERGARALIAYVLASDAWGNGFAFEASSAAIAYVRSAARVESIDAYVDPRNARSVKLVERLGFAFVALLPNNDIIDGLPADDLHYRLDLSKDEPTHP